MKKLLVGLMALLSFSSFSSVKVSKYDQQKYNILIVDSDESIEECESSLKSVLSQLREVPNVVFHNPKATVKCYDDRFDGKASFKARILYIKL